MHPLKKLLAVRRGVRRRRSERKMPFFMDCFIADGLDALLVARAVRAHVSNAHARAVRAHVHLKQIVRLFHCMNDCACASVSICSDADCLAVKKH